jgi:hypothetical protein
MAQRKFESVKRDLRTFQSRILPDQKESFTFTESYRVRQASRFIARLAGTDDIGCNRLMAAHFKWLCPKPESILRLRILKVIGKSYNHFEAISRMVEIVGAMGAGTSAAATKRLSFIVRVDDFPHWRHSDLQFLNFHRVLARYQIPYLLGVTPFLSKSPLDVSCSDFGRLDPNECQILKRLLRESVTIALHGFTHQTRNKWLKSELHHITPPDLIMWLDRSLKELQEACSSNVRIFIPPYNAITSSQADIVAQYLPVICGGPESVFWMGFHMCPSYTGKAVYVPSYPPFYGLARDVANAIKRLALPNYSCVIIPIVLHWAWEIKDNFVGLESLCRTISGQTLAWNSLAESWISLARN